MVAQTRNRMIMVALAAMLLLLARGAAAAEQPTVKGRAADSFISIKFANPALPEIHASGVAEPQPYGVYDTPEQRRAKNRVALETPPPDLRAYALQWERNEWWDVRRLELAAGAAAWCDPWTWDGVTGPPYSLVRPLLFGRALRPTPPEAYPLYNLTEYNAALAEWRRARERAAMDREVKR